MIRLDQIAVACDEVQAPTARVIGMPLGQVPLPVLLAAAGRDTTGRTPGPFQPEEIPYESETDYF